MNQQNNDARRLRPLATPLYAMAALLVLTPLIQLGARLGWSLMPGSMQWRTGALGLLASAILTPSLGLLVAIVTACVFEHRTTQLVLGGLAGLASFGLVAILAVFALDGFQMRAAVGAQYRPSFTGSLVQALLVYALTAAVLATLAVGVFKMDRRRARAAESERRGARAGDVPLLSWSAPRSGAAPPDSSAHDSRGGGSTVGSS